MWGFPVMLKRAAAARVHPLESASRPWLFLPGRCVTRPHFPSHCLFRAMVSDRILGLGGLKFSESNFQVTAAQA